MSRDRPHPLVSLERIGNSLKLKRVAKDWGTTLVIQQNEAHYISASIHEEIDRRLLGRIGVDRVSLGGRGDRRETFERNVCFRSSIGIIPSLTLEVTKFLWLRWARVRRRSRAIRPHGKFREITGQCLLLRGEETKTRRVWSLGCLGVDDQSSCRPTSTSP